MYNNNNKNNRKGNMYSYSDCVKSTAISTIQSINCPNCQATLISDNGFICLPPKNDKPKDNFIRDNFMNDNSIKYTKYHKIPEINGVEGFVVNVHDPTNFDIDFKFNDPGISNRYCHVISNKYTYKDLTDNFKLSASCDSEAETSYDIEKLLNNKTSTLETGTAYRCRLKGIGIQQNQTKYHKWRNNQLKIEIINLIDRTDGWVTCNLSDIDVYKRLLVDITIHTNNGPIDLCEYLLNRMKNEEHPLFYPYKPNSPNNSF